ncbi:MAG: cation diffusion facilitator family transporter [Oscillospiraceae bacterium]|nr:cation diffusion facilitator family transporter [Oscillospiraceae bacterium]
MIDFFVKHFIRNSTEVENPDVRKAYGTLSSVVGIICNIILFCIKYFAGVLSGSIAILSDAFNNLSDCASCLVTFFGYKMAAKPADKGHPFGHGRAEYLTSLLIAIFIVLMGVELLRDSVKKLLSPEPVTFHWLVLCILLFSIAVKLWMAFFNRKLGKRIGSSVMIATAKDSYSDVLATTATLIVLIVSLFTEIPLDGWMGILVSLFILKTAYDIIRDTVDDLLGKPADAELVQQICNLIRTNEEILGIHDLVIHNYGPGKMIGSCHVEVSSQSNFVAIHDKIDRIEHQIQEQLHINMTIHMDPIELDNAQVNACREMLLQVLHQLDPHLHIHDFRMVSGETHTNLIFDLVVPFDCSYKDDKLKELIDAALETQPVQYYTVITFDREYTAIDLETDGVMQVKK